MGQERNWIRIQEIGFKVREFWKCAITTFTHITTIIIFPFLNKLLLSLLCFVFGSFCFDSEIQMMSYAAMFFSGIPGPSMTSI